MYKENSKSRRRIWTKLTGSTDHEPVWNDWGLIGKGSLCDNPAWRGESLSGFSIYPQGEALAGQPCCNCSTVVGDMHSNDCSSSCYSYCTNWLL